MSRKARFSPSAFKSEQNPEMQNHSEEQIEKAREEIRQEQAKKRRRIQKIDTFWAIVSTIYAIISTSVLLANNWVDGVLSYVILAILCLYVFIFLILCVVVYKKPDSQLPMKAYGKIIKILKAAANVAFLVLSAMALAGMAKQGFNLGKWIVFVATFAVALVKLAIKIYSFVSYLVQRRTAKNYSVQVTRYVDGEKQKKTFLDKRKEKKFKN